MAGVPLISMKSTARLTMLLVAILLSSTSMAIRHWMPSGLRLLLVSGASLPTRRLVIPKRSTGSVPCSPWRLTLDTTAQHRGAYWLVVNRLLAELGIEELKDNCGQKPERLWYGNQGAVFKVNDGASCPAFLLKTSTLMTPLSTRTASAKRSTSSVANGSYRSSCAPLTTMSRVLLRPCHGCRRRWHGLV